MDKIIFRFAPRQYKLESIEYQLKHLDEAVLAARKDIENAGVERLAQLADINMREMAERNTVELLKKFRSQMDSVNRLKVAIEEIRFQMQTIKPERYESAVDERLKMTTDKFENAEQNFNVVLNKFMNFLANVYSDDNTKEHAMKVAQLTQIIAKYIPKEYKKNYAPYFEYYSVIAALLLMSVKNTFLTVF
jgi:HD-GYP domain-containing protein (c-di-GMP phosphodiesterase class II)